jgi:hypothetical protein
MQVYAQAWSFSARSSCARRLIALSVGVGAMRRARAALNCMDQRRKISFHLFLTQSVCTPHRIAAPMQHHFYRTTRRGW